MILNPSHVAVIFICNLKITFKKFSQRSPQILLFLLFYFHTFYIKLFYHRQDMFFSHFLDEKTEEKKI